MDSKSRFSVKGSSNPIRDIQGLKERQGRYAPNSKEDVRAKLDEGGKYDDILLTNDYLKLKDYALERGFITKQEANSIAKHKADRVASLITEGKANQFAGREYRPDMSPEAALAKRQEIGAGYAAQAPIERQKDIELLGKMGYTPEDVAKFGTDRSGFIPSGVPIIGGNEVPIASQSFWQDPIRNLGISAYQGGVGLGATAEGMVAPARALATRFTGGDPTQFYAPNENPLVEAGTIFGSNAAESAAGFPARYAGMRIGGELGFKGGMALSGGNPLWGGVGAVAGGMLGQLGMGHAMETLNDAAMNLILGRENAARLQQRKQEMSAAYPLAARVGEELPDLTMFGPSFKVKGFSGKAAAKGFKQAGMKGLRQGVVDTTEFAGDLAERGGESALNMVLAYKQSEDEKKLGMPGKSAWDILAEGALGAVMQGDTKFGRAIYGGMNRLTDPGMIQQAINRTAPGAAAMPMSPAVDTGTPLRPGMRRFNLGGRIESGVDEDGSPIIKGARYAVYDPETRKAQVYTDNEFALEGARTRKAAQSLKGTSTIFKRQPIIQYDDKVAGSQRQILGITRDAGVLVRDYTNDGKSTISAVPLSDIRNAKINKRINEVIENQGVRANSRPAPFMPESFTNFNPVAFPDAVTLTTDSEPIPARVVERIGGKTDASYIVALPDGTHIRAHESQINVDKFTGGEHIIRGAMKDTDFPRSLADLAPKRGGLKGLVRIGEGADAPEVELTPAQRKDYQAIASTYQPDIDAIKREPDATRRSQMLDIVQGKIANEYLATNPIPAPSGEFKEGDVIDVNLSQTNFGNKAQTAIVTDVNDYGYAVRLVDHPNVGTFTVQDANVVGRAVPSMASGSGAKGLESLAAGRISGRDTTATSGEGVPAVTRGYSSRGIAATDVPSIGVTAKHVDYVELPASVQSAIQKRFKQALDNDEIQSGKTVEFVESAGDTQVHGQIHVHSLDNMTFQIVASTFPEGGGRMKEQNVSTYNVRYNPDTDMWDVYSVAPEIAERIGESDEAAYMAISHLKNVRPAGFADTLTKQGVDAKNIKLISDTFLEAVNTKFLIPENYRSEDDYQKLLIRNFGDIKAGKYINEFEIDKYNPSRYYVDVWSKAPLDMSDPAQFARASDAGRQIYTALRDDRDGIAASTNKKRKDSLKKLMDDVYGDVKNVDITPIEFQMYFMMASKWNIDPRLDDNDNVIVKLAEISKNNESLPIVYSQVNVRDFSTNLRNGQNPKTAFHNAAITSMQRNIDSRNVPTNGWKTYKGRANDVKELMQDVQGTIWCIASEDTYAHSYLSKGDFHVYFSNGKPTIAYGGDENGIFEAPRGNRTNQSVTATESQIAIDHMKSIGANTGYETDIKANKSAANIIDGIGTQEDVDNVNLLKTVEIPTYNATDILANLQSGYELDGNQNNRYSNKYHDYGTGKSQLTLLTELPTFKENYNKLVPSNKREFSINNVNRIQVNSPDDYEALKSIYKDFVKNKPVYHAIELSSDTFSVYSLGRSGREVFDAASSSTAVIELAAKVADNNLGINTEDFDGDLSWVESAHHNRLLIHVPQYAKNKVIKLSSGGGIGLVNAANKIAITFTKHFNSNSARNISVVQGDFATTSIVGTNEDSTDLSVTSNNGLVNVIDSSVADIKGQHSKLVLDNCKTSYLKYDQLFSDSNFVVDINFKGENQPSLNHIGLLKSNPTVINLNNQVNDLPFHITEYDGSIDNRITGNYEIGTYRPSSETAEVREYKLRVNVDNMYLPYSVGHAKISTDMGIRPPHITMANDSQALSLDVNSGVNYTPIEITRRRGDTRGNSIVVTDNGSGNFIRVYNNGTPRMHFKVYGNQNGSVSLFYGRRMDLQVLAQKRNGIVDVTLADNKGFTLDTIKEAFNDETVRGSSALDDHSAAIKQVVSAVTEAELYNDVNTFRDYDLSKINLEVNMETVPDDLKNALINYDDISRNGYQQTDFSNNGKKSLFDISDAIPLFDNNEATGSSNDVITFPEGQIPGPPDSGNEAAYQEFGDEDVTPSGAPKKVSNGYKLKGSFRISVPTSQLRRYREERMKIAATYAPNSDAYKRAMRKLEKEYGTLIRSTTSQVLSMVNKLATEQRPNVTGYQQKETTKDRIGYAIKADDRDFTKLPKPADGTPDNRLGKFKMMFNALGEDYQVDAFRVSNRAQLKTVLQKQYKYDATNAGRVAEVVDRFARAWAMDKIQQTGFRPTEIVEITGKLSENINELGAYANPSSDMLFQHFPGGSTAETKLVAQYMREFYEDRFAAFGVLDEAYAFTKKFRGAIFRTAKTKDDAIFNVIVGFASRDETTGIHEIAHALFRGMGYRFQKSIAEAMGINSAVLRSEKMKGRVPIWVEEKFAAAFEGSLRAGLAPRAKDVLDASRPRQQDPTLGQLWDEIGEFLTGARNATVAKLIASGEVPEFGKDDKGTRWLAKFNPADKLYAGNELELRDGSFVQVETTQAEAGAPLRVRDVDSAKVSTIDVTDILRYGGRVPNGFNNATLDTLSTWLRSYYTKTAENISTTLPDMIADYSGGEVDLGQLRAEATNLQRVAFQEVMDEPRSPLLSSLSRINSVQAGLKSLLENNRLDIGNKGTVKNAYDRYGKPSNSFRVLRDVYGFDGNTAAAYYAQTETQEFKKWSENLPLLEAVQSIQVSPDIDMNKMSPEERVNYRRYEAGKELADLASDIMRDGADDNDVDKFIDLTDQYYRNESRSQKEIRKAVEDIVDANDDENVQQLMSFEMALRQELAMSPDFESARDITSATNAYRDAAHTPRTGKGFVTVSFPAMESSNLIRSKNGVVLTSGVTSFDGNRQGGEYIKFKNPQVVNLEGQGIDQQKLDRIIANATKAKRDGVVLLNLRHSNTVNSALHNVAVPITRYPTKSIAAVPGVDLATYFSGGGTLEASVYESVFPKMAVEYDAEIASVYRANHGDHVQVKDVQEVDPTSLKDVQWFHASPVCKNFSDASPNAIETILDVKTGKAVVDAIDHSRPPIVTIENVRKYQKSESFHAILEALRRNGYEFDYGVYKTSKYGGGTSRERLIVRGVRGFRLPPVIQPNHEHRTWYESIKDIVDTLPISELVPNQQRKLQASGIDVRTMKTPVLFTQNTYHPIGITADKVFPSFTTSGGTYRILMPGGVVRAVTPIALRRMMGLPDAYLLPESDTLARKILANGVPAELSQLIMAPLADAYARDRMTRLVNQEMRRQDTGEEAAYQEDNPNRRISDKAMLSYVAQTANISESDVQKLIDNGSLPKPIDGQYDPITFRALQARVSVAISTGKDGKLNWDNAVRFVPIIRDLNKKQIPFDTDGALDFSELVHWLKTRKGELFPMPNVRGESLTVERMIRTFTNQNVFPAEYIVGGDRSGLMYDPRILSALETYTNMRHNGYAVEFIKGVLNPDAEQRTLQGGVGVKEFLDMLNAGREKPITQDIITNWRVKGNYIPAMLNNPAHGVGKLFTPDHLLIAEKIADLIDAGVSMSPTKGQLKARLLEDSEYVEAFTRIVSHPWYQSTSTTTMESIKEAKPIMRMADVIAAIAKEVEPNKFNVANYQALERSGNIPKGLKPSDGTTRRQYNDDYVKLAVMALNPKYRGKTAEFRKQDPEYAKLWNKIDAAVKDSESGTEEAAYQEADDLFPSQRRTVETYDMPGAPSHVERIRPKQLPPRNAWFWGAIDLYNDITRLPLSGDLAFQNLQGGIIGLSNPLVGLKAFKAGLQGFAPNMQVEVGGKLYGSRKFGREQYHAAGEAMRRNPIYHLAKQANLPLAMFEIDARLQEAREIELHNLKMTNPNATMKDVKIDLMDIDELGTVDEWYSKNRITRHLPMQGQFERFNSLVHDTLLLTQFDNWVKVLLSKGYQPNTTMFNNAIKDAARVLAVSVGDIKYSTNPEVDAAASRIAKIFFTAPRWLMSRALIDPFINQMVSNSSIFARLRELMGEDNPAFNLYNGDKEVAKLGQSMWLRIAGLEAMLAIMAWVFSNWYPDTEVNTDIQPGRIRIGDFQIDPMAGLIDHYKLAGRLAKAVFSVDPKDASRAEKEGIPQWMMAVKDISKELSYKASPGITFLQAITGMNDLKAQTDSFFTAPWEAKSMNVVGEPLFERSASAKIFYEMIRPRLRELFGDAVADDLPISNMMMDRIPMALPGFIDSFAQAKEYNRDPWVYALADTIPNFFGFKVDVMPTEARKDRAKEKNSFTAEDSPTLLRLLAEGRGSEAFTGTVKSSPPQGNVQPW